MISGGARALFFVFFLEGSGCQCLLNDGRIKRISELNGV
jgi:hypothetical protein